MRLTRDSYMQNCELRSYRVTNDKWSREDGYSITNTVLNILPMYRELTHAPPSADAPTLVSLAPGP